MTTSTDPPTRTPRKKARTLELAPSGPTGSRTPAGKQRSRYNAVKHAIFAEGVLCGRESERDYCTLVNELAESVQPVGRLEEILAEKLAMLLWRYRRLLQAEAAEVGRATHSIEHENSEGKAIAAHMQIGNLGLISKAFLTRNEFALMTAVHALKELRDRIQQGGLDWERDRDTLKLLHGQGTPDDERAGTTKSDGKNAADPGGELAAKYCELALLEKADGGTGFRADESRKLIVGLIEKEMTHLEDLLEEWMLRASERRELQTAATLVPRQEVVDRLQRYEGGLERAFDRTLAQLERLQRLRLGQPVPPQIKVSLSQ